jgi:predicted transcriptional regulator
MVRDGIPEQQIRDHFSTTDAKGKSRAMSAVEFAQQIKQSMVETGEIKQASRQKTAEKKIVYQVTTTGRLTISDFSELTGAKEGESFVLESPRGRSKAWRLVSVVS